MTTREIIYIYIYKITITYDVKMEKITSLIRVVGHKYNLIKYMSSNKTTDKFYLVFEVNSNW